MIRLFWLVALFCIDLRVKAEPEVYAAHSQKTWDGAGLHVIMQPGSLIEKREGDTVHLIKGQFLIELKDSATVKSVFATLGCAAGQCRALVERTAERLVVKALKGEFMVRRLGDPQHYALMAGAGVIVLPVTDEGVAEMDFPEALPWESTVKEWAKFFPGTIKEFKPTLVQFREDWKLAVEKLSELHAEHASRTIASHDKEVAEELARKAAQEREDAKYRKLFREKTLGP